MPESDKANSRGTDQKELLTLMDTATGCYVVTSASSAQHAIDFDSGTLTRTAGELGDEPTKLRCDGTPVGLQAVISCTVGRPAQFQVRLSPDRVIDTVRTTTTVVRIERLVESQTPPVLQAEAERR
ncbi:hypothetical protein [Cryobacterium sp. HLT2-28]|uniref:hypothetical protein n=1 Tax=Cryobacterium sp. HLT2-28 TaxID=1259146 RepID=UPI00106D1503|nr:hypothetical protein [Cryobacterium sp. HLT2-28]TFB93208.1 hypothetical protein E3O48_11225 [Cryobacterium sp. HLT2-28]